MNASSTIYQTANTLSARFVQDALRGSNGSIGGAGSFCRKTTQARAWVKGSQGQAAKGSHNWAVPTDELTDPDDLLQRDSVGMKLMWGLG